MEPRKHPLVRSMRQAIAAHRMMRPGDAVLVAVSGGPDSTALLHALYQLREPLGVRLFAVHVHHGIRGDEADEDARYVQALCDALGVPLTVERAKVAELASGRPGLSLEAAGREVRYRVFEALAERLGAARVAIAHTADDQAETVLMWLLRGAGLDGLAGIPPVRGRFVRPLLWVWRREVEDYDRRFGLSPREDRTNRDLRFLRNRIRHRLLPLLESEFHAGVRSGLVRLADIVRSEQAWTQEAAMAAFERLASVTAAEGPEGQRGVAVGAIGVVSSVRLPRHEMALLPEALRRRLIRLGYERVRGDRNRLGFEHVERVLEMAAPGAPSGKWLPLPGGVRARIDRAWLTVEAYRGGAS